MFFTDLIKNIHGFALINKIRFYICKRI